MPFGLTPQGFFPKRQSDIITEMQESLRAKFGKNLNFVPSSVFSQLIGTQSEREAEVWEMAEAIYASRYPSGAEGVSVDNLLAEIGLRRLGARPTTVSLTLYGDPGTFIEAGSLISIDGDSTIQFATDEDATIAAAEDAVQSLTFTAVPDAGGFKLSIVDPNDDVLETSEIAYDDDATDIQTKIRALTGYDDVTVTGSFILGFTITFAGDSGEQPQNTFSIEDNDMMSGMTAVNVGVIVVNRGTEAKAETTATCTEDGPKSAIANTVTVIDSPVTGWDSVTNFEEADPGRNIETDTEALQRRTELLSAPANGPLQAIVADVRQLDDVEAAKGFENLEDTRDYSTQFIAFSNEPTSGDFQIRLNGVPGDSTVALNWNDTFDEIQTAINDIEGFEDVTVTGNFADGFVLTFPSDFHNQPIIAVTNSSLSDGVDDVEATVTGGRPPNSVEIVVDGGDEDEIAQAIYDSKPAGTPTFGNVGPFTIVDDDGFEHSIKFSRPTEVPIYVKINLTTTASFPTNGVSQIQAKIVEIGSQLGIGESVIVFGSNGLVGAFNEIAGITDYELFVGKTANPTEDDNILVQPEQLATFDSFNVIVTVG